MCLRNSNAQPVHCAYTFNYSQRAACRGLMPTVDTASTVAMDRSLKRDKKEMIEMVSSFRYLDRACGESIRTQEGEAKTKQWSKQLKASFRYLEKGASI